MHFIAPVIKFQSNVFPSLSQRYFGLEDDWTNNADPESQF